MARTSNAFFVPVLPHPPLATPKYKDSPDTPPVHPHLTKATHTKPPNHKQFLPQTCQAKATQAPQAAVVAVAVAAATPLTRSLAPAPTLR